MAKEMSRRGQMQCSMSQSMRDRVVRLSVDFLQSRGAEEGGGPKDSRRDEDRHFIAIEPKASYDRHLLVKEQS